MTPPHSSSTSSSYYFTKQQPFPPWILFVAGLLLGTSSEVTHWLRTYAETVLVSFYATGVTIYLCYSTWTRRKTSSKTVKEATTTTAERTQPFITPPDNGAQQPTTTITTISAPDDTIPQTTSLLPKQQQQQQQQPIDLTGAYQLISNQNFEEFLAVQGVPWALRRAANAARPLHRITHKGNQLSIQIQGIIESQTTYIIDGPPVETNVRGRIFEDAVEYIVTDQGQYQGIRVRKKALTEDYDVTVERVLSSDRKEIVLTSTAYFRDHRPSVTSTQQFRRVE